MRKFTFSSSVEIAPLLFVFFVAGLLVSCTSKNDERERYISDSDTTYSADVRSISERINKSPEDASLYAIRANTFYYEENYPEALLDIEQSILLSPNEALFYYRKGEYLMSMDSVDSKSVKKAYQKSIELNPEFSDAILAYSKLLIARMEYKEADRMLSKALSVDNTNSKAYFLRGMSRKEQNDTAGAINMFSKAVSHDDSYFDAVLQIGDLYAAQNNELALLYFDRALAINEYSADAYYSKGLYLQNHSKFKDALKMYERTIELNSGYRLAYYNLAYIMIEFENYSDAHKQLDKAIEVDPGYENAYNLKGVCYQKEGNLELAREYYNRTISLNPDNPFAKRNLEKLDKN